MNKKEEILKQYFEHHKKQKEIAKDVNVNQSYIAQIIKNDDRYLQEKEHRHNLSADKKKSYNKNYFKSYIRPKQYSSTKDDYEVFQAKLALDSKVLSSQSNISNDKFVYLNIGAYKSNKSGNLVIDKSITVTKDTPKFLNRHRTIPSQKMKHQVYQ